MERHSCWVRNVHQDTTAVYDSSSNRACDEEVQERKRLCHSIQPGNANRPLRLPSPQRREQVDT